MSKSLKNSNLAERPVASATIRTLLAVSLCASIAAFGCTTDRTVGNGDPVVTPGLRTSPTGGATTGTETESIPPPMMSSYSGAQALPAVRPRIARVSREEAALLLAEMQPRVRVLGPVAPGPSGRVYASDEIGRRLQSVEARSTINSSIYSPAPDAGIISGAGEAVGGVTVNPGTGTVIDGGGLTTSSNLAGTNVTNAGGAAFIAPTTAATATPTGTAIVTPSALASVRTLSPTAASVVNPPASISGSPALATVSSSRTAGTVARGATITPGAVNAQAATVQPISTTSVGVNAVRVVNANGRVTVTNVNTTSGRQQ